jgi:hypothetical protein
VTVTDEPSAREPEIAPATTPPPSGRVARWVVGDPVRAVAVLLIVVQLVWRVLIAGRGFLAFDDFTLASSAAESAPTPSFLTAVYNNHMMPGTMLVTWLVTRAAGLAYWPYVTLLTAAQATVSIAFYRLLRRLLPARWGLLVPLAVFLFCPLTLELTSWWAVGANLLPMQLATVLAIGAQARYVRTGRPRHLLTLALSVVLGLLFYEKSLLIVPLVFLVTVCLFVRGGPLRSVALAVRRYWRAWLVLLVVTGAYLPLYLTRSNNSLHGPRSVREATTFVRQLVGTTLVPGLVGGPWRWLGTGDGAPLAVTHEVARWLSWAVLVAVVAVSIRLRTWAIRPWVLLVLYVAIDAALLTMTRLGLYFSSAAGLAPRYIGDVVVVAALCLGVALFGLVDVADEAPVRPRTWPAATWNQSAAAAALVLALTALLFSQGWSTARFGDLWSVKAGRDYLHNAEADLAKVPPKTVFLDTALPETVQSRLTYPYNLQSRFFRPVKDGPTFVTEAENPWMFDDTGHAHPATVAGIPNEPGTDRYCHGYRLDKGLPVRIPLTQKLYQWQWVVRIGYLSSGESFMLLRFGTTERFLQLHPGGIRQLILTLDGGGDALELTVQDPNVVTCTNDIIVGHPVPRP